MADAKRRQGRTPLPREEALKGYGMHFRPASLAELRELCAFRDRSSREIFEGEIARLIAKARREPLYREWVAAGRPIPLADWVAAGKPSGWNGRFLNS